jgi:cobalt-zinc-cadmium efflux system membrane fusion protein
MRKLEMNILICCLLTVLLFGGCALREEANIVSAETTQASGTAEENTFSGRAEAIETVEIVSKLAGKVSEVNVKIGSDVEKGQTLLQLDARELAANVDAARASLDNAEIAYQTALENQKRAEMLLENGAIGSADYENNYLNVLKRAGAAVDLARASLEKALIAYQDSTVTAPINGTVTEVNIETGEMTSMQIPCIVLINLDEINIKLYVGEKKINSLQVGQSYKVEFSGIPGKSFEGAVSSISGAMDEVSKGYRVDVTVLNSEHEIKDGMFAKVYL